MKSFFVNKEDTLLKFIITKIYILTTLTNGFLIEIKVNEKEMRIGEGSLDGLN